MMSVKYINPTWVVVEFLRKNIVDPRESRRPVEKVKTVTSGEGDKVFSLDVSSGMSFSHVESVKVNGDVVKKWGRYWIDLRNQSINFFDGLSEGDSVEIVFYEGVGNWIYWDRIRPDLNESQFPRVSVLIATGSGTRLGTPEAPVESTANFQIDIFVKERSKNHIFEIDGYMWSGEDLVDKIGFDFQRAFEDNERELFPVLYDYSPGGFPPRNMGFDSELQAHRRALECEFKGVDLGKLKVI